MLFLAALIYNLIYVQHFWMGHTWVVYQGWVAYQGLGACTYNWVLKAKLMLHECFYNTRSKTRNHINARKNMFVCS